MAEINFSEIENKWQDRWEKKKVFEAVDKSDKPKYYVLEMFPYPSAAGLHIGHAFNFTIGDVFSRFKRMQGYNVLHPMGFDSLGLPAENAAIKVKQHPEDYTNNSIKNFTKQQRTLGLTYDWSRQVNTADPEYYKWDQWIFLKMFEKGLVYEKEAAVNWCSKCNTILANEQVVNGKCWRHDDTEVDIKQMNQWFLKITDYADRLLEGHKKLNWPEKTIAMQKNWIGKSHGTEIDFEVESKPSNVIIVHGANSNEREAKQGGVENTRHWFPWLKKELQDKGISVSVELYPKDWNPNYLEWKKIFEKNIIDENTILVGHSAGCGFLLKWLNESNKKVKKVIFVAPYLLRSKELPHLDSLVDFKLSLDIEKKFDELIVFYSNNDYSFIQDSVNFLKERVEGNFVEFVGKGHFCKRDGFEEFPELIKEISYEKWPIFTTRPDTIFGVTFVVVSAQHKNLFDLVTKEQKKEVENFLKKLKSVSEKDLGEMEKEGVFTGSYAINPATKEKVPVYAGNFVVADYGSGMVMAVPTHDQRDFEFAKKYNIPLKQVIVSTEGNYLVVEKSLEEEAVKELNKFGDVSVQEEDKDWGRFFRVKVSKGKEKDFVSFLENNLRTDNGKWFADSFGTSNVVVFPKKSFVISEEKSLKDYFEYGNKLKIPKKQLNAGVSLSRAYTESGKLINSGEFNGISNEEAKEKITAWLISKNFARKKVNFKLRDWSVARQRYWGTPIPLIHCEKCGVVPVPENDLPVKLPKEVKFGEGNPLLTNEKWLNVKCPKCGGKARREANTMDTFVNSSWYFLRYCDPHNDKEIFDKKKAKYWMPVDLYIGGAEHACMHLIYSRFYTMFLHDLGLIDFDEPAPRLFHQGMINGPDGEKMSKSKGNVVEPLETMAKYGVDATRFFLLSEASPDKGFNWSDKGIQGSTRIISKIWSIGQDIKFGKDSDELLSKLNQSIKNVAEQIEILDYRKSTIEIRELFDLIATQKEVSKESFGNALKLLSLFCPHIAEELYEKLGNKEFISVSEWPKADLSKIKKKGEGIDLNEKVSKQIKDVLERMKEKGVEAKTVFLYVVPFEVEKYNLAKLKKETGKEIIIHSVKDADKYDPENKSKKAIPGMPGIYLE